MLLRPWPGRVRLPGNSRWPTRDKWRWAFVPKIAFAAKKRQCVANLPHLQCQENIVLVIHGQGEKNVISGPHFAWRWTIFRCSDKWIYILYFVFCVVRDSSILKCDEWNCILNSKPALGSHLFGTNIRCRDHFHKNTYSSHFCRKEKTMNILLAHETMLVVKDLNEIQNDSGASKVLHWMPFAILQVAISLKKISKLPEDNLCSSPRRHLCAWPL